MDFSIKFIPSDTAAQPLQFEMIIGSSLMLTEVRKKIEDYLKPLTPKGTVWQEPFLTLVTNKQDIYILYDTEKYLQPGSLEPNQELVVYQQEPLEHLEYSE